MTDYYQPFYFDNGDSIPLTLQIITLCIIIFVLWIVMKIVEAGFKEV